VDLSVYLIVCPLVFLAGFVDAIAGGGGLISLPAWLLAGVPMHYALGSNKLASSLGSVTAAARYYKNRLVDLPLCLPSVAAALAGSAIGSSLTLGVSETALQKLLLLVLPVTAFYVFRSRRFTASPQPLPRKRTFLYTTVISFVVGGYDGFFGPGTGTFLILLYTGLARLDFRVSAGNAKVVNMASNLAAAAVFILNGKTLFPPALCAGAFSVLGSFVGAGLAIKRGAKLIRAFTLVVLAILFVKIAWDFFQ